MLLKRQKHARRISGKIANWSGSENSVKSHPSFGLFYGGFIYSLGDRLCHALQFDFCSSGHPHRFLETAAFLAPRGDTPFPMRGILRKCRPAQRQRPARPSASENWPRPCVSYSPAQQRTRTCGLQLLARDDISRRTLQVVGDGLDPDLDGSRRLGGVEVLKRKEQRPEPSTIFCTGV
jgi:hypothetical protein